ncbi:MAG: tRNA uridine-5-carboxymethylaminomethyl(34) synthesis GTPase MnmE [Deltaproteobacteria bacterium]|nr:tRNA uridine-5-carboxymethylaminomethyl(34) synthesis GTPase MnmE [Deltaproteobacteria bacterium]
MLTPSIDDTICAISTPIGEGGIGIVKISGPHALPILRGLFTPSARLCPFESHRLYHGWLRDPVTGATLDEVLVTFMAAPRTYTRQDVVEINCHSGFAVLNRALELILQRGARLAEPGEFTRRAFLNGRIDLSQAEAVIDLIQSRSEKSLTLAGRHLQGDLGRRLGNWRERLLQFQSELEVHIDFSDDVSEDPADLSMLASRLATELIDPISRLSAEFAAGRIVREGLTLVLVGKPNVGKSSLLNALIGKERAIVTPWPGTTRDVVEDSFLLSGILVRVLDTAGIRHQPDAIESMGIERTLQSVGVADAVLWLLDRSRPLEEEDDAVFRAVAATRHIILLNKADLPPSFSEEAVRERYGMEAPLLSLSVLKEGDLQRLREVLNETIIKQPLALSQSMIVPNLRQQKCLEESLDALRRAHELLVSGQGTELVSLELGAARRHLETILGLNCDEALLDSIFARFCVGK